MRARHLISIAIFTTAIGSCRPATAPTTAPVGNGKRSASPELSSKARLGRAQQRFELGNYLEAEADFHALLNSPESMSARLGLADVLVTTGRSEAALAVLVPLSDPAAMAPAAVLRARALQSRGDAAGAERVLRAVPETSASPAVRLALGSVLLQQGRRSAAE